MRRRMGRKTRRMQEKRTRSRNPDPVCICLLRCFLRGSLLCRLCPVKPGTEDETYCMERSFVPLFSIYIVICFVFVPLLWFLFVLVHLLFFIFVCMCFFFFFISWSISLSLSFSSSSMILLCPFLSRSLFTAKVNNATLTECLMVDPAQPCC